MECTRPLTGYHARGGGFTSNQKQAIRVGNVLAKLVVPCGKCYACRERKASDWAIRMYHEAQMHYASTFITLTYDNEHLPENGTSKIEHFQKFMKRFRKSIQPARIRFYHCGEYGKVLNTLGDSRRREYLPHPIQGDREAHGRPHYHAIIFGWDFPDKKQWSIRNGHPTYRSKHLEKLWPFGISEIGTVTYDSAKYVAGYIQKKINGDQSEDYYKRVDYLTGQIHVLQKEYATMSRRPGIGMPWLVKHHQEIWGYDECIIDGKNKPVPRAYTTRLKIDDPETYKKILHQRQKAAKLRKDERSPERLAIKDKIGIIRLNQKKRELPQ